jgi:hypothetical protein
MDALSLETAEIVANELTVRGFHDTAEIDNLTYKTIIVVRYFSKIQYQYSFGTLHFRHVSVDTRVHG